MSKEMVRLERRDSSPLEFSDDQKRMIFDAYANGATEDEFQVLLEIARVRGLNPLLRQIHFVKRWDSQKRRDVWSAQASIDGMRAIAERTGLYDGQDEPEYERNEAGAIIAAKVRVYRKDWSRPAVGVAYWSEYVQTTKEGAPTAFWRRMPHVMLAKCAEAIALRKAFPEDTGGLYVPEELGEEEPSRPAFDSIKPEPPRLVAKQPEPEVPAVDFDARADYFVALLAEASLDGLETIAAQIREQMKGGHPRHRVRLAKAFSDRKNFLAAQKEAS